MKKTKTLRSTFAEKRNAARAAIVETTNLYRREVSNDATPRYSVRRLQQAMCVVRRNQLVRPAVLITAGFNV